MTDPIAKAHRNETIAANRRRVLWQRIKRDFPLMARHMVEGKKAGLTFEEPVISEIGLGIWHHTKG